MFHTQVYNCCWINTVHCSVRSRRKDLANFSVIAAPNHKNRTTKKSHHRVKVNRRHRAKVLIQAAIKNKTMIWIYWKKLGRNTKVSINWVVAVDRMARNHPTAETIRNVRNGLHLAWLDQRLRLQPFRTMGTRIRKSAGKIWQGKYCRHLQLTRKREIMPLISIFSLISRGNVERLEVVNKKWVRVVMVPGTETTTVSPFI